MGSSAALAPRQKTALLSVQGKEAKPLFPGSGGAGWRFLIDPAGDPAVNMARDEEIADRVRLGLDPPTLRIYRWNQPAITLGRRQNPDDLPADLLKKELPILRRPTGGGAVIHRLDELTYALAMHRRHLPPPIPLSRLPGVLHRSFRDQLVARGFFDLRELEVVRENSTGPFSLCFTAPVCGDLLYEGRKVAGSALRAWRDGFLLQGSLQGFPVPSAHLIQALIRAAGAVLAGKICRGGDLNPDELSLTTP